VADTNGINGSGSNLPAPHNIGLPRSSDNVVVSTNQNPFLLPETKGTTSPTTVSDIKEIRKEVKTLTDLAKQYLLSGEKVPDSVKAALKSANDKKDAASGDSGITSVLGRLTDRLGMFSKLSESLPGMSKTPALGSGKEISSAIADGMKSFTSGKKEGSDTKELMAMMDDNQLVEYEGMKQAFSDATKGLLGSGGGNLFDGMAESLSEVLPIDDVLGAIGGITSIVTGIFGAVTSIMQTVESRMNLASDMQAKVSPYLQKLSDAVGAAEYWGHVEVATGKLFGKGGALQGTGLMTYEEYFNSMSSIAASGYLKDFESRVFISTMKENILPTFNETNSTLIRILRLVDRGNSDSTYQRLAIQSYLTKYLNEYYEDSEYLHGQFDAIESALVDSIALRSNAASLEYESTVQAWTSSLYASGVSSNAISNIAKGIDYLASGNIEALSQNESLINFFAIAAAKSGQSLADILVNGLDNSEIYSMLDVIVRYLAEISKDSNNVVRSEYAKIFGMSVADLVGIQNFVESGKIDALSKGVLSAQDTATEFAVQLWSLFNNDAFRSYAGSRIPVQSYFANVLDNALTQTALNIGNNLGTYSAYKIAGVIGNIADTVSVVFKPAKIVGIIAQVAQVIGVFTSLVSSVTGSIANVVGGAAMDSYGLNTYRNLVGSDRSASLANESSRIAAALTAARESIEDKLLAAEQSATENMSETNQLVNESSAEATSQGENKDSYVSDIKEEAKNMTSAEVIESSTDEESVVRIGMFNSDALFQLRRAISEVLENAGIISVGSPSSSSGGQSSMQSMLESDRGGKIANLVHSINDSVWAIAQNLSTKEGDNIGQMIKEIASDVDTIQRDVDGVSDNMALVTNKYIMS